MASSERRRFVRIDYPTPAALTGPDGTDGVEVVDLSIKGALLRVPPESSYRKDVLYQLRIDLTGEVVDASTGEGDDILSMDLRPAHEGPGEGLVGFQCERIDVDSLTFLREIVERHCGDPELIHRDLLQLIADDSD